ncbi:MAG TPA: hypothetical protein VK426_03990 [Methanobacterium sp.]|nr:hypothetical protein [Methanobacterium sp.]
MESLDLTPAESLIIISPDSTGIEMIKITLIDLLLKKALKLNIGQNKSQFLKKNCKSVTIIKNKSNELIFKPHEKILMDFLGNGGLELKEFAKTLLLQINPSEYKNSVRMPLIDKNYFKRQRKMLLSLVPYNTYILTEEGIKVRYMIMKLLDESLYLEKWIKEDLGRAKAYLSVMGSHMLLTNVEVKNIQKFNKMLSYIKPETKTSDYYKYYLYKVPDGFLDNRGDIRNFDFIDISFFDNFESLDDFFSEFEDEFNDVE